VLADFTNSGAIPVVRLTEVFRQQSRVIVNAHRINRGQMPELTAADGSNFFFVPAHDPARGSCSPSSVTVSRRGSGSTPCATCRCSAR
jgi:hypothetical protein